MVTASKILPTIQDERVIGTIGKLQNAYLGPDYTKRGEIAGGDVTPEMIAPLSKESFPMFLTNSQLPLK